MKQYDFDRVVDRQATGATKIEAMEQFFGSRELIPMWIADMDFETPPFILDALRSRLEHPVLGYTMMPDELWTSIATWVASHHGWHVEREWITTVPGVVRGIGLAINALTMPGDGIIIQPPVYHPFRWLTEGNHRRIVYNPLVQREDGLYDMDFEGLERVADDGCRMLILANPHNPGGVTWSRATLERLAEFCHSRGIVVISDEIHCDLTLWGGRHIPFASVSPEAAACSITFGAPTKTFNVAGVVSSYAITPSEELRAKFYEWMEVNELNQPHMFGPITTIAAFTHGEPWRRELLRYIEGNIDFVIDYCAQNIPSIRPIRPQASYLVWLDCRALGLEHEELVRLFIEGAGLALNDGALFGAEGRGFMRMNVACPRSVLEMALERLRGALAK